MTAKIISGTQVAAEIREELKGRVAALKKKGITPVLAVVLVGEDPASVSYVTAKAKGAEEIGMLEETIRLPANTSEEEVLKTVGLWERKDLFPAQLAIGEIQRVAIARAFIAQPPVLLADEPTGNLDPVTSRQLMKILKEINGKGTTVVMATHNAEIVNQFKERVILLKEGKIVSDKEKSKYQVD